MRNYRSNNSSRDRRDSPRRSSGGRDYQRPTMHNAVCDECGKDCKVPFRPSGDKPIYCSDCFERKGGGDNRSDRRNSNRRFDNRDSNRSSQPSISDQSISQLVEKIDVLNTKLTAIITLLPSAKPKKADFVVNKTEKKKKSKKAKKK